jgi:hypothetical protein
MDQKFVQSTNIAVPLNQAGLGGGSADCKLSTNHPAHEERPQTSPVSALGCYRQLTIELTGLRLTL